MPVCKLGGAKVLFYRLDMGVVHNFFECFYDHGRDVDASVVRVLFGDVDLRYRGLIFALIQKSGQMSVDSDKFQTWVITGVNSSA